MSTAVKRKTKSDDEDDDNRLKPKSVSKTSANEWVKLKDNLQKSKNKAHDNYDASKFISPFRKPLANVPTNSANNNAQLKAAVTGAGSPAPIGSSSHV